MSYPNLFDLQTIRNSSALTKFFLIIFVTFSSFLILGFLFILLAIPVFHFNLAEINSILRGNIDYNNIAFVKYYQATQSIGLFVAPAILLNYFLFTNYSHTITIRNRYFLLISLLIICLMFFLIPLVEKLMQLNEIIPFPVSVENKFNQLENEADEITDKLLAGKSIYDFLINVLIIAIIPAIGEEFFFRGVIQRLFHQWFKKGHLAVILAAILFSGIHLQFYGFIARMALGLLFGYIYYWSRNIWFPILGHFMNNFITVLIKYLSDQGKISSATTSNSTNDVFMLLTSLILTSILLLYVYRICLVQITRKFD